MRLVIGTLSCSLWRHCNGEPCGSPSARGAALKCASIPSTWIALDNMTVTKQNTSCEHFVVHTVFKQTFISWWLSNNILTSPKNVPRFSGTFVKIMICMCLIDNIGTALVCSASLVVIDYYPSGMNIIGRFEDALWPSHKFWMIWWICFIPRI